MADFNEAGFALRQTTQHGEAVMKNPGDEQKAGASPDVASRHSHGQILPPCPPTLAELRNTQTFFEEREGPYAVWDVVCLDPRGVPLGLICTFFFLLYTIPTIFRTWCSHPRNVKNNRLEGRGLCFHGRARGPRREGA